MGSLGIAVTARHIWRCRVSQIANTVLAHGAGIRPTPGGTSRQIPESHFIFPLIAKEKIGWQALPDAAPSGERCLLDHRGAQ